MPPSLQELRQKLGQKAKQRSEVSLLCVSTDWMCRRDVLEAAWAAVRRNKGAPGVDGVSIEQIDAATPEGEAECSGEIQAELAARDLSAQAVRRVYIPKPNGKMRPLGIPTVRDRVVQTAALLILEPIFEADFEDCSLWVSTRHGRRTTRLEDIREHLQARAYWRCMTRTWTATSIRIPHDKLLACVRMRIVDGSVLGLIRQWLKAPVVEPPRGGNRRRCDATTGAPRKEACSVRCWPTSTCTGSTTCFNGRTARRSGPRRSWCAMRTTLSVLARYISPQLRGIGSRANWKGGWGCKSTGRRLGWWTCGRLARAWTSWATPFGMTATAMGGPAALLEPGALAQGDGAGTGGYRRFTS